MAGRLDIDMAILLGEDGAGATSEGEQDQPGDDAGERLEASRGRVVGPARLRDAAHHILAMAARAGWRGGEPAAAYLLPPGADAGEVGGRGFALQGAAADAVLVFPGADPAAVDAHPLSEPEGATAVSPCDGGCEVRISYLGSGPGADGFEELAQALRDAGLDVTP
jgi:hypothetical protein